MTPPQSVLEIADMLLMVAFNQHLNGNWRLEYYSFASRWSGGNPDSWTKSLPIKTQKQKSRREVIGWVSMDHWITSNQLLCSFSCKPHTWSNAGTCAPPVGLHNEGPFNKWDLLLHLNSPSDQIRPATEQWQHNFQRLHCTSRRGDKTVKN